jgi:AraC-like DNA-binding protein
VNKKKLENEVVKLMPSQKMSLIYRLLSAETVNDSSFTNEFKYLGIDSRPRYYIVLIFVINDIDTLFKFDDINACKAMVDKAIDLSGLKIAGIFHNDIDKETVIGYSEDPEKNKAKNNIENEAKKIYTRLINENNISVTITGSIAESLKEISRAYYEAFEALKYTKKINDSNVQWFGSYNFDNKGQDSALMKNIVLYLDQNFTNSQISLFGVADHFGITEHYLSRLFKEKQGINFSKYIEQQRMNYVRILLSKGEKAVNAGKLSGYNSYGVFSRAYRRYFGKSPSNFIPRGTQND